VAKILWGESNNVKIKSDFYSLNKGIFNDKFHVFSIIWEPTKITWLLNNQVYFEQIVDDTMIETFNKPFHLILNLAVGGQFPGDPDNTTIFPQELIVDYIRIFQKQ
jgi:beta-glucanase (GH16 family)